VAHIK
jgi:hypothetical protein